MRPAPVLLVVAAFGAGLATGLAHFLVPGTIMAALGLAVLWRDRDHVLIPLALVAGVVHGSMARHLNPGQCVSNPVVRFGTLRPCTGQSPGPPSAPGSLRGWLEATSAALYGPRAPIVDALVLGKRTRMDPALRDAFTRSGLVHLLSISGFHVGLIVAWLVLLLRVVRVPRPWAAGLAAMAGVAYVGFLGWPAPASRAAALACLAALCIVRQRRVQPTPLLAATCLAVLLFDPWAVFDLGGWLSATALWGATAYTRWGTHAVGRAAIWRTLFASVGAVLATAPVTAAAFGAVAIVGIPLNFLAIPLAAVAVPGVAASLLAARWLPPAAEAFAAGSGLALALLERVATIGAAVPGGMVVTPAGWPGALLGSAALCLGLWIAADRAAGRESLRRAAVVFALCWAPLAIAEARGRGDGDGRLSLFFLAVGQGDGIAIRTPHGRWVVVDAGPADARRDAGREVVVPFLRRRGVREVSLLVVSHAHLDHLGGVGAVFDAFAVRAAAEPGWPLPDSLYRGFLDRVAAEGARWTRASRGATWELDGVRFRAIHPDTAWSRWGEDLNEDSVVLLVEYGAFRALLTGDAGLPVEQSLRGRVGRVDLLKVGHHGSRGATGGGWLAELSPRAAVLSVGKNRYGHPHPTVVARLDSAGIPSWRTDRDGTVQVSTDGCRVALRSRRATLDYIARGTACQDGLPSPPLRPSSSSRNGPSRAPPAN